MAVCAPLASADRKTDAAAADRGRRRGRATPLPNLPDRGGAALPLPTPHFHLPPSPPTSRPRPALAVSPAISRDYANAAATAPPRLSAPRPPRALPGRVSARGRGALWDSGGIKCTLGAAVVEGAGASGV